MENLTDQQIEAVMCWMETWEQLKDTAIPIRFKEDFTGQLPQSDVIKSLPYDVVIVDMGNGEWYHGFDKPLQHKWDINGDRATCLVCNQVIEKRYRNEA